MTDFIQGENRTQSVLFPERLDDYVSEENAVRVIDVFVDELDLSGLGFKDEPSVLGRPGYAPGTMLKIYIYGYLNQVQSSRRLEREAGRNVELMWLTGRLAPDFKTIADFRKDHGTGIRAVCREFIVLCRQLNLFKDMIVAIDGSKFRAVNNREKNFSRAKMKRRLELVEKSLDRYFALLDSTDREEGALAEKKGVRLKEKISRLKEKMRELKALEVEMNNSPDRQISLTDPDARAIATNARSSGIVGYNVQAAGRFARRDFHYDEKTDTYVCPAGDRLIWRMKRRESGLMMHRYWSSNCQSCSLKTRCTPSTERRVSRWEHEAVLEAVQKRLDEEPEKLRLRKQTIEHPFGTIKTWMGSSHFKMKTLKHVSTEMSLHVLAYNLKRVINIMGIRPLIQAMQT